MPRLIDMQFKLERQEGNTTLAVSLWAGAWAQDMRPLLICYDQRSASWAWEHRCWTAAQTLKSSYGRKELMDSIAWPGRINNRPALVSCADIIIVDDARLAAEKMREAGAPAPLEAYLLNYARPRAQIILLGS